MMEFLRKHMRTVFAITMVGFFAGIFIGFGSYMFRKTYDSVAVIDGTKISYADFQNQLNRVVDNLRNTNTDVTPQVLAQKKQEVINDLIQQEIFWKEAQKMGITVSDNELAADIQHYPAFQVSGHFDQRAYFQVLFQRLNTTPEKFEAAERKRIAYSKLRQLIATSVRVTEPELQMEYARTHKGSMKNFEKDKAKLSETLRQEKTSLVFNQWFNQINQTLQGRVKVYLDEIEKRG